MDASPQCMIIVFVLQRDIVLLNSRLTHGMSGSQYVQRANIVQVDAERRAVYPTPTTLTFVRNATLAG